MQFESLKVFCDVARHRSFSQAAAENGVTQSAVSQTISLLEKERLKGVLLIDRSTRPLQLTPLGQLYYEGCKRLWDEYTELEASLRRAQSELAANVQVAAIYSVGLGDMGQLVQSFEAQHPNAQIHLEYLHPDRVYERVLNRTADFGLVSFPKKARDLISHAWRQEVMVLACAPGHPLAEGRGIRAAQLANQRYIGFERGLVIRREVDRFLREQNVAVDVALEFDNIDSIKKAVEVSAGVALLPEPTLRREVAAGTLVAVPLLDCRMVRPLGIIQRRHHLLSATARRFLDLLRHPEGSGATRRSEHGSSAGNTRRQGNNGSHRTKNGSGRSTRNTVVT
jgi:DNA-binding transcriptional LysR family regulator